MSKRRSSSTTVAEWTAFAIAAAVVLGVMAASRCSGSDRRGWPRRPSGARGGDAAGRGRLRHHGRGAQRRRPHGRGGPGGRHPSRSPTRCWRPSRSWPSCRATARPTSSSSSPKTPPPAASTSPWPPTRCPDLAWRASGSNNAARDYPKAGSNGLLIRRSRRRRARWHSPPLHRGCHSSVFGLRLMPDRHCSEPGCPSRHYARGWCRRHYQRWWRTGSPTQSTVRRGDSRPCPSCLRTLGVTQFSPKGKWRQTYCKDCRARHARTAYRRAPDRSRERARHRHQQNRDQELERMRRWRKNNPVLVQALWRNRAARERSARGSATALQVRWRVAYYGDRCAYCHGPVQQIDHVKPLAAGGTNFPANLRPTCAACNRRKHARWPLPADLLVPPLASERQRRAWRRLSQ